MAAVDKEHIVFNNGKYWDTKPVKSGYRLFLFSSDGRLSRIVNDKNQYDTREGTYVDFNDLNCKCLSSSRYRDNETCQPAVQQRLHYGEYKHLKFYHIEYVPEDVRCAFMWDDFGNHYVWLGGYGHNGNPYTHFIHRGYGKDFEKKMLKECYSWLMEDVLEDISWLLKTCPFNCEYLSENNEEWIEEVDYCSNESFKDKVWKEFKYKPKK